MATYYPSVSYPRDYLSTPCLSDQSTSIAGTPPHPSNSPMYLNQPSSSGAFSDILSGSSLTLQNGVAITTVGGRNEMSFIPPTSNSESLQSVNGQLSIQASNVMHNSVSMDPQTMPRTVMNNLDGEQSFQTQGLSLSLGTQIPSGVSVPSFQYQYQGYPSLFSNFVSFSGKGTLTCSIDEVKSNDIRNIEGIGSGFAGASGTPSETEALSHPQYSLGHKVLHSDIYHYGPGFANPTLNTKYLKATQDLLDEVVNIHKALKQPDPDKDQTSQSKPSNGVSSDPSESITNSNSELSPAERQELQNKKTKLMAMLDEVDRRYRQYYHQMKIVVTSFDVIAGSGAAKPYTALAIQTISRHFRTLRDAISGQVQVARKSLGEEDTSSNSPGAVIPRLRYVDHQLKQQRALQQLGVTRHAWRPQRGLPESSVSILRAWLFEHFLHPYPKDSEKIMLAKQTGLTRNQVANWFINARVRLWKPMIEDMYKEEFGEKDENSKSSLEKTEKPPGEDSSASDDRKEDLQDSMTSKVSDANCVQQGTIQNFNFDHMPNAEIHGQVETSVFESGSHADITSSAGAARLQVIQGPKMDTVYPDSMLTSSQNGNNSFMAAAGMYDLTELGGFAGGNQVSLALGLQHQQNNVFSLSGDANMQRNNRVTSASEPDTVDFHCTDPANEQNRPMYYMIL